MSGVAFQKSEVVEGILRRMESPFLTPAEVAAYLRVDVATVRRWCKSGELPAFRAGGKGIFRISREDLSSFVKTAQAS